MKGGISGLGLITDQVSQQLCPIGMHMNHDALCINKQFVATTAAGNDKQFNLSMSL